jgi:multidrug efflux pump subunit AcrA (membrane-fusion protein)
MKKIMVIVLSGFIVTGCQNKKEAQSENVFYVQTEKIKKRDLKNEIIIAGTLKAMDEAIIYPRTNGKLIKNLVREGDRVKKDEPVALIKKDEVGVVYEPAPVYSTIDGYIGRVYQDVGADVNPQTPIVLVVNQDYLRLQADIPEKYLGSITLGQKIYVKVEAYPNKIFWGKIDKISPVVDKISRTFLVEAFFDNNENLLKSGMTAETHIIISEVKNAPSIPLSAIVYRDGKPFVYIADRENNIAIEKQVVLGLKNTDWVEVRNLKEGTEIITVGLYGIKDKARIKIVNSEM